jgi:1-acyl-sn-glycerol-3-phosphate acyltransferase
MANEVINKVCQTESFRRNGSCRVISINWGPWESGMVNARHEKFFEFAGFHLISVSEGSDLFVKEICDSRQNKPVEVVIHGTKEDEIDDPARDADQGPVEIAWQIQLEQTPWIKDHSPTFLIPVLPMTGELEMMCSHAASVFPGETLIRVNGLESKQWAAFESDCLSGRTLVHVRGKGMAEVELQIRAPGESSPVYTMVARAELIFGKVYPQPDDELIPDIENPKPVPDPYGSGALFHGTSLQLMTSLEQGKNGCRSVVSCESRGVPHGCVHPGMLDAVLHGVPWYPEIVNTMMAFPIGLDKLFIYEKFPEHGSVSVEARTLHSHQRYFPVTRIWILDGKRQLARFDLTLMLLPKGPFAKIPGKSWKRFLACQGHVSGIGLLTGHEDVRIMKLDDVKTMDWLPGTLSKVYQVPEQENGFFEKIAMKTHAGSCLFLHPSRICIDTSTGRCMNLPLNDFFLTSEQKENRIITRATGPGRLDVSNMTAFWEQRTGISRNILSDMILSFFLKFVRRLILEDPDQYTSVKKGPALYLGNHQTGIESLLLAFVLGYLTRSPFYGLTNQEQGHGMLSVLKHLADNFLSIKLPVHMLVFDQQKRESLYDHLREYRIRARESNACLYLAAEGRRALQAGQSISQVSSVFIDFAIENRIPVVPVRFTGGLPRNSVGNLFDFPYGYGSQDYYIGKAIMPEILKELDYGKRPRYIVDRINNLGPEKDEEIPFGPDAPFQEAVAVQMKTSGISELSAMIVESLNLLDDPCDETLALKKRIRTKDMDGLDDTSALFAIMTLLTMG